MASTMNMTPMTDTLPSNLKVVVMLYLQMRCTPHLSMKACFPFCVQEHTFIS